MRSDVFELHSRLEVDHWWFRARREIVGGLLSALLPGRPDVTVVDVGCGTGATIAFLSDAYRCVGIDPVEEAIAIARRTYPDLEFVHGEAPGDVPKGARTVDAFLLMDVLEHVADDARLLGDLVGSARPGARFLVTVPANPALWTHHDVSHGHYRRYEREDLARLLRYLPANVDLLSHFNARLYPLLWPVRRLERLGGWTVGPAGTDLRLPPAPVNRCLYRVFRGERYRLLAALLEGSSGYSRGLSLMAVFTKRGDESA